MNKELFERFEDEASGLYTLKKKCLKRPHDPCSHRLCSFSATMIHHLLFVSVRVWQSATVLRTHQPSGLSIMDVSSQQASKQEQGCYNKVSLPRL